MSLQKEPLTAWVGVDLPILVERMAAEQDGQFGGKLLIFVNLENSRSDSGILTYVEMTIA